MTDGPVIIVGAGHAGYQVAASLRQAGFSERVCLINDEAHLPYQRPPLSKGYIKGAAGPESLMFRPEKFYHDQTIVKDGVIPNEIIRTATSFRAPCAGLNPPRGIWCHVTGTDLVRHSDGQIYVLEDNLRCPSGVSYVLQNRLLIKRTFPRVFESSRVRPVDDYPDPPGCRPKFPCPDICPARPGQ